MAGRPAGTWPFNRDLAGASDASGESAASLREHLRARLPPFMVPAHFVFLDELPHTPSGKIDRQALPAIELAVWIGAGPGGAHRDEEALAALFGEVLHLPRIGIPQDFWALGGHSLRAMQLVNRIRESLQADVGIRALFDAPTIAGLAARIDDAAAARGGAVGEARGGAARAAQGDGSLPPLVRLDATGPRPVSFAQERLWFLERSRTRSGLYNMQVAARIRGPLDAAALTAGLREIVRRHHMLRSRFGERDGRPYQIVEELPPLEIPIRELDRWRLGPAEAESECERIRQDEADRPFDLERAPLIRAVLVRMEPEQHVLAVTMHHIVSDGWSLSVMLRELSALYRAFHRGEPSPLEELPVQYADFAAWQSGWLTPEYLRPHAEYWRRWLHAAPPPLHVPGDRGGGAGGAGAKGQVHRALLSPALGHELRELGPRHGATPFMVTFAGFAALLQRLSGRSDVVVGIPLASRPRAELERLIGLFLHTHALRVDVGAGAGVAFPELLRRVQP